MPTTRVIAGIQCCRGRLVQGVRQVPLWGAGDPCAIAALYEAQGADELVLTDSDAVADGDDTGLGTLRLIRERLSIPLTVGGAVAHRRDVAALLDAGADKVSVNIAAVHNPHLISEMANRHGSQCAVLALDAAVKPGGGWEVVSRDGTERYGRDAVQWAEHAEALGIGEILVTSHDHAGRRAGYDLALLKAITAAVNVPVVAAGEASDAEHMLQALAHGADAVLAAPLSDNEQIRIDAIKKRLAEAGLWMRL